MKKKVKQIPLIHKKRPIILSRYFFTGGVIFVFLCICLVGFIIYKAQTRPVVELPKNEMKKIPLAVKKELDTQQKQASEEAALRVPILMYHYVEYVQDKKDTMRQLLNISPNIFEEQVRTLLGAGYTFMTAKELGEVLDGRRLLPKKPVLLTFDDGHWDFDTDVLPILKKYHVKATAYIISGFLGGSDFMDSKQLQDVIASGLVDVGAHTVHHVSLAGKLYPIVQYEVDESKKMLEGTYHIHVVSFAYPDGTFDQQAISIVRSAGFTTAVSTLPGIMQSDKNRYYLYRIRPGYRTGQTLLQYLQQTTFSAY